jgi:hypothetical protein
VIVQSATDEYVALGTNLLKTLADTPLGACAMLTRERVDARRVCRRSFEAGAVAHTASTQGACVCVSRLRV